MQRRTAPSPLTHGRPTVHPAPEDTDVQRDARLSYLPLAGPVWFTVWSSLVHGGRANLLGDVPALFFVAGVPWRLVPRAAPVGSPVGV